MMVAVGFNPRLRKKMVYVLGNMGAWHPDEREAVALR
jgi:hypothetical protein